ncbi:MAG: hypothetical protein OER80_06040 [Gammaproteobacteria bacterium]|nr:hypothetical protein [Gammaproteobacteria bacterium]MDH3767027.1 hypothetical protein [Gammaproteobacteria bacterium]
MQALITLIYPFLSIVAHRAGPEDLPRSSFLLGLVVVAHIAIYFAGMILLDVTAPRTLALPLLDTLTQLMFFSALLAGMGLQARLPQTLTAVFGADVLLNSLSVPVAMMVPETSESFTDNLPALAAIGILLWSLGVKGHILHRAVGFPYFVGVLIALGFYIALLVLDTTLFGVPS